MDNDAAVHAGVTVDGQEVRHMVWRVVNALAPVPVAPDATDSLLVDHLGFNSLRLVDLSFHLEELFDLETLTTDSAPPIGSVGDLQDYVVQMVAEGVATVPDPEMLSQYALPDAGARGLIAGYEDDDEPR